MIPTDFNFIVFQIESSTAFVKFLTIYQAKIMPSLLLLSAVANVDSKSRLPELLTPRLSGCQIFYTNTGIM